MGLPVNGESKRRRGPVCFRLIWLRLEGAEHGEEIEALRYGESKEARGREKAEGRRGKQKKTMIKSESMRGGGRGGVFAEGFRICDLVLSLCVLSTSQSHKPFR